MDTHRFVVREISKQVKTFHEKKHPFRVYHGATSHSARGMHDPRAIVRTGDLHNILDINIESKFAMVEPNVTMDRLVKETLKHGLIPPVVPSFPGTTVGGTFSGTAGGSSSFKYGFFDRAISWLEIVLPDGTITTASRVRNPELLSCMVGTLGTLGITTLFQIHLVTATAYVELTYLPVESAIEALDTMNLCSQDPWNDFVEGLVYGPKASAYAVIAVGKLSSEKNYKQCTFSGARDDWYYQHVIEAGSRTETIPILDYLFRYDRGSFCLGRFCFGRIPLNKWTRMLADRALHSRALAEMTQAEHWSDHFIIQDLVMPVETTFEMLTFLENDLEIYPMRLCPIRQWPEINAIMRPNPRKTSLFMGIGIRGYTNDTIRDSRKFKEKNREIEHVVSRLGGIKWLYSRSYYTEDEFYQIYNRQEYEALRKKYKAEYLASVYEKIKVPERPVKTQRAMGFWNFVFARTSVLAMKQGREHGVKAESTSRFGLLYNCLN